MTKRKHDLTIDQIKVYLDALHDFWKVHKMTFVGESELKIQQYISEGIIKYIYDLDDYSRSNKIFDAEIMNSNKTYTYFEIKATSSYKGSVDLNLSNKPDVLIWIWFDIGSKKITVHYKRNIRVIKSNEDFFEKDFLDSPKKIKSFTERESGVVSTPMHRILWEHKKEYDFDTITSEIDFRSSE